MFYTLHSIQNKKLPLLGNKTDFANGCRDVSYFEQTVG